MLSIPRRAILVAMLAAVLGRAAAASEPTRADISPSMPPEIRALVEQTFSPDPQKRTAAADRIADLHNAGRDMAAAVPFLVRLLGDEAGVRSASATVGVSAASALQEIGAAAIEPLTRALQRSSARKKIPVMAAMIYFKDARIIAALVPPLADPDALVRYWAARALEACLREAPGLGSAPGLTASLRLALVRAAPASDTQLYLIEALGHCRGPAAVEPLVAMLRASDGDTRASAIAALAEIGDRRAERALLGVMRGAKDEDERGSAAAALGKLLRRARARS